MFAVKLYMENNIGDITDGRLPFRADSCVVQCRLVQRSTLHTLDRIHSNMQISEMAAAVIGWHTWQVATAD